MIDTRTLQTFLKTEGYYTGSVDGIFGPASFGAARAALSAAKVNAGQWSNDRVLIALNQLFLNKVISAGLVVDGLSGPRTNDAVYTYNATQLHTTVTKVWPKQIDVRSGKSTFGRPGYNQTEVACPYVMFGDYARKIRVTKFQCHSKVAESLHRILQRTLDHYGPTRIRSLNLDIFSGCYNYRPTTGSSSLSMHAWGVAVDIDAAHNQMDESRDYAAFAGAVYDPFLDFWEQEGWVSLGRARNYDWMHFQAARL